MSLCLFPMILSNDVVGTVDRVRLSLEAESAFWFSWVKHAGYAVAVGCAMEAPETYVILKRWWLLKFRDEDREETKEDKKSWIVPLAAAGLLIIVAGIVVETYCEGRVSDVDALLRGHESDNITAAENNAASATIEAGEANERAANADLRRVELQKRIAWRHLTPEEQQDLYERVVRLFPTREFGILETNELGDPEITDFSNTLRLALTAEFPPHTPAKIKDAWIPMPPAGGGQALGLLVQVLPSRSKSTDEAADALVHWFNAHGLLARKDSHPQELVSFAPSNSKDPANGIEIVVGRRP